MEAALADATGGQEGANGRLVALGAARERLGLRHESATTLRAALEADLVEARAIAKAGRALAARARAAGERARRYEHAPQPPSVTTSPSAPVRPTSDSRRSSAALAEREGIPPAASALAAAGETLALSALSVEPGAERAVAAALAWRASAVLAGDARRGLELLERTRRDGLGSLTVVVDREAAATMTPPVAGATPLGSKAGGNPSALRLLEGFWLVGPDRLLEATHGTVITSEGHGYDPERGELWFAGETAESVLLEMEARRRALADETAELAGRSSSAAHAADRGRRQRPPRRRRRSRRWRTSESGTSIPRFSALSSALFRRLEANIGRARRGRGRARGADCGAPHARSAAGGRSRGGAAAAVGPRGERGPRRRGCRSAGPVRGGRCRSPRWKRRFEPRRRCGQSRRARGRGVVAARARRSGRRDRTRGRRPGARGRRGLARTSAAPIGARSRHARPAL